LKPRLRFGAKWPTHLRMDMLPLHLNLLLMRLAHSSGGLPDLSESWKHFTPLNLWAQSQQSEARHARNQSKRNLRQQKRDRRERNQNRENNEPSPLPEAPDFTQLFPFIQNEALARSHAFLQGMQAVLASSYAREDEDHAILWERGNARLIDYAPEQSDAPAIFIVPSLINRSHILDLTPDLSFIKHLHDAGLRPVLLDWGVPDDELMDFGCTDYIGALALEALQTFRESHDGPIILLGYCMGGVFATAMAQLAHHSLDALILLATPWDFSAPDSPRVALPGPASVMLRQCLSTMNPVPHLMINGFFHLIDPWALQQRYAKFPELSDVEKIHFLAVEHWANDGVPLARTVAIETFVDWPQDNILHNGGFKVGRKWIEPEAIRLPTLCVMPERDRIVPLSSSEPLARRIPRCDMLTPPLGHVSMVASTRAKAAVWHPITAWIQEKF
jgi:polyhydroxyalkanoate synthase